MTHDTWVTFKTLVTKEFLLIRRNKWLTAGAWVSALLAVAVVFGTAATLLACLITARMPSRWLAPLPPVVCNALIVGFEVAWSEVGFTAALLPAYALNMFTVGLGELCACYLLGLPLLSALSRVPLVQQLAPEDRLARLS